MQQVTGQPETGPTSGPSGLTNGVATFEIGPRTRRQYEVTLKVLKSLNIKIENTTIVELIGSLKGIKKVDGSDYKDISNFLKAIQWYLKGVTGNDELKESISKALKEISKVQTEKDDKNELSGEQKVNYLEWEDIIRISRKVKNNRNLSEENHKEYVIMSLYELFDGVRRIKDYSEMYISDGNEISDKSRNYYLRKGKESYFIFNNYKTSYIYGSQTFRVPVRLRNIINGYIDMYKIRGSLLSLSEGGLKERIRTIFHRYVDKSIGVNILRHSYITYNEKQGNLTKERRKELANRMAHTVDMQLSYIKYTTGIEKPKIRNNKKHITKRGRKRIYTEEQRVERARERKRRWREGQKKVKGVEVEDKKDSC